MSYEKLEGRKLATAITGMVKANNNVHVQSVLASVIFSAMHGNTDPLNKAAGKGLLPAKQRGYLLEHAIKAFCKKDKASKAYRFNQEKAQETFIALGVEGAADISWEMLTELLPDWNPKTDADSKKFDAIGSAKRLLKRAQTAQETGEYDGTAESLEMLIKALKAFDV